MPRNNGRVVKRVRWKVIRADGLNGWTPVVLIGEVPIYFHHEPDKPAAKTIAREQCSRLRGAGQ